MFGVFLQTRTQPILNQKVDPNTILADQFGKIVIQQKRKTTQIPNLKAYSFRVEAFIDN